MILNISGRTDIVAFYTPWLMNRLKDGFVLVQNPFDPHQLSRIYFDEVDLIVFCTKDPRPILPYLDILKIPFVFQITLTPYHKDIEPNVSHKKDILSSIHLLKKHCILAKPILRYDPILLNDRYTTSYHIHAFDKLCQDLEGVIDKIIISFVDIYKNVKKHQQELRLKPIQETDMFVLADAFSKSASQHGICVQTCFEKVDLSPFGISQNVCLSVEEAFRFTGKIFPKWKARPCGCVEMVDIGSYNTCSHLCKYCYANYDEQSVKSNRSRHDPKSPLLIGTLQNDQIIKDRHDHIIFK